MEEKKLELRMYFFVPYNISPIQQAIQAGHAAIEYARNFGDSEEFKNFADNWKTWVILDGGTTNDSANDTLRGTLNQIADSLVNNGIKFSSFQEPDLNDALTAVCVIVDERVFNKKDYPDFINYLTKSILTNSEIIEIRITPIKEVKIKYSETYIKWIKMIGGVKNEFLRELLTDKKLA